MNTDELREKYLSFFESKGCVRRPSDVLVPRWDPSVLFTPAGMNQFKDHFLGRCKLEYTRATTCQKCLRTGDIDNVGRTAYHHTFFEMLGNFSFGDYFKREAIHWAWEFLTDRKWLGIGADRLTASVYLEDDEAYNIWRDEIKLPAERIKRFGEADNFWPASAPSQGPDGVCGPCSEIFFHPPTGGGEVEIWNLVFTQFNRVGAPPNNLSPLPSKNIDTGMGLERTAAVLQGVETNFHIDILRPIVEAAAEVCGMRYDPSSEEGRRLRRITDHIRACTFAVHEEVYPGPDKQKYVVRRLLRRAVLDGHQMGVRKPFLHQLVPVVAQMMKPAYPELSQTVERVAKVIQGEEEGFLSKIDAGLERIERLFEGLKRGGEAIVAGSDAADLYKTHGFPPELLETLAAERNLKFDWPGFEVAMEKHSVDSGGGVRKELFKTGPLDPLKKTHEATQFLGYEQTDADAQIIGLLAQDQLVELLDEVGHDQPISVILDRTPFYGESGGQVGDVGELVAPGVRFEVIDTQKEDGFTLHVGHLRSGKLQLETKVTARVDTNRRAGIRRAHSATHLLHFALQKHLGSHALQQGSKVDNDWLRFDFANPSAVGREVLDRIESEVNDRVTLAEPVGWKQLPIAEARKAGAMMLFGEKYPDVVRMVSMGDFSKELCGGTHVSNTGQVGLFHITAEESVSAGTRRITAVTGREALRRLHAAEHALSETAAALKVPVAEVAVRAAALVKEIRDLKKQIVAGSRSAELSPDKLLAEATQIGDVKVVVAEAPGADAQAMRQLIDQLRKKSSPIAVLLGSREEEKVTLIVDISRDLEERGLNAGVWIRSAAEVVGGRGGGRPDLAQAGGKHPENLAEALEAAKQGIEKLLEK